MSFFKNKGQKVKHVPSGGWYQWEGRGYKKGVKEGEHGRNTMMYKNGKIKPGETILRREDEIKDNDEGSKFN
jgi:hypothetical protein